MNHEIASSNNKRITNKIFSTIDLNINNKNIPEYISKSPSFIVNGCTVQPLNTTLKQPDSANIYYSSNNSLTMVAGKILKEFDLLSVPLDIIKIALSTINLLHVKKDLKKSDTKQINNEANINELLEDINKLVSKLDSETIAKLTEKDAVLTETDYNRLHNLEAMARLSDKDYKKATLGKYIAVANAAKQSIKVASIATKKAYLKPVLKAVGVDHPKAVSKFIKPYIKGIYTPVYMIRSGTKALEESKKVSQTYNENFEKGRHILPEDINKLMQENLLLKRNIGTLGSVGYAAKAISKPFEISNMLVSVPAMIMILTKKVLDAQYIAHKSLIPEDKLADIGPLNNIYSALRQSNNIQKVVDEEIDKSGLNRPVLTINFLHKYYLNNIDFSKIEMNNCENLIKTIENFKKDTSDLNKVQREYLNNQVTHLNKKIELNQITINTNEKDINDLISSIKPIDCYDTASREFREFFDLDVKPKEEFDPYKPANIEKFRKCLRKEGLESLFLKELLQKNKEFYTVKSELESDEKNTVVSIDFKKLYTDLSENERSETHKKAKNHMNLFYDVAGDFLATTLKAKHRQIKNQLLEFLFERIALNQEEESDKLKEVTK